MSDISTWNPDATNNMQPVPDGFPEGMAPSGVNNAAREVMAAVRRWYETAEWIDFGDIPTFLSANSFSVPGDRTEIYHLNRRLRLLDNGIFLYASVANVTLVGAVTNVTVDVDGGPLSSNLQSVAAGAAGAVNRSIDHRSLGLGPFAAESEIATAHIANGAVTSAKLHADLHHYVRLNSVNLTGQADVRFTNDISPNYTSYLITLDDVVPSNGADINMRFSADGGASYFATGYQYIIAARDAFGADFPSGNQSSPHIPIIASEANNNAGHSVRSRIKISNLASSALYKSVRIESCYFDLNDIYVKCEVCAALTDNVATINAILVDALPGSFSAGSMTLYGFKQ